MSLQRYIVEVAIPEPISPQVQGRIKAFENAVKAILPDAVIINEGQMNEENTKRFQKHLCNHDIGQSCSPWEDI